MSGELEELQREVARLNAKVEMLEVKLRICLEAVAELREEFARLRRRARPPSLREYVKTLEAYSGVGHDEQEPP